MRRSKQWTALALSALVVGACSSSRSDDDDGRTRPVSVGAVQTAPVSTVAVPIGAAHYANDRAQFVGAAEPAASVVSAAAPASTGGITATTQTGAATVTGATRGTTGLVPGVANAANPNSVSDQSITPTAVAGKSEVASTAAATPVPPLDRPAAGTAPSVPNSTLANDYTAAIAERQVTPTIAAGSNPIVSTANISSPSAVLDRSTVEDRAANLSEANTTVTGTTAAAPVARAATTQASTVPVPVAVTPASETTAVTPVASTPAPAPTSAQATAKKASSTSTAKSTSKKPSKKTSKKSN